MEHHVEKRRDRSSAAGNPAKLEKAGDKAVASFIDRRPAALQLQRLKQIMDRSSPSRDLVRPTSHPLHVAQGNSRGQAIQPYSGKATGRRGQPPAPGHSGVAQRVGKKGHIAIGAVIGTLVPIIGTIIGGYIGYRIWKSKQAAGVRSDISETEATAHEPKEKDRVPELERRSVSELKTVKKELPKARRSGKRAARKEEGPPRATDHPVELLAWIESVRAMIQGSRFADAYDQLTDPANGDSFGITVRANQRRRGDPEKLAESNLSKAGERTIDLYILDPSIPDNLEWLKNEGMAMRVLPMHLEEYMHQYQAMSNSFLSGNTEAFKAQSDLTDVGEELAIDAADFDEVDVMAKLIDWGFDVEEIGYVGRYDERSEYWGWWGDQAV
jgi:hypothetical protein